MPHEPKRRKPTKAELRAKRKLAARDQQRSIEGRRIPVSSQTAGLLDELKVAFKAKFGREPGDDPLLFDPNADTPQPISKDMFKDMVLEMTGGRFDDIDRMMDGMAIGAFRFGDIADKLELIDRVIGDPNATDDDYSSAYELLVEMTSAVIEQTNPADQKYVPREPPMVNPTIDDIRKKLFVMRADFAEYWGQYVAKYLPPLPPFGMSKQ